ncbi:MAG: YfcE family phosphodiesterase, partial [Clostridia bacterium]|nr:YfcE family phosphodiesterase [Clostridia bacterium]
LFDEYKNIPHVAVKGNCDFASCYGGETYLDEQTVDLGEIRVFACHGHKYGVKSSELNLWMRAREKGVDLALFGHTHEPFERVFEGVRLFNPGSIGQGSYGVIYVEKKGIVASHGRV